MVQQQKTVFVAEVIVIIAANVVARFAATFVV